MLNNVWKTSQCSIKAKTVSELRTFHPTARLRMPEDGSDLNKLSTCHTKNLRKILRILWPETIFNQHPLARCNQDSMGTMRRRWRWIGPVMRREATSPAHVFHWIPEGKRTQGHLASNCKRGVQDPPSDLTDRSETGLEQTGVGYLCCCPTCQPA